MDGLEAVEICFSKAKEKNDDFRINSEYFKKIYTKNNSIPIKPVIDFANVSDGDHSKFPDNQKDERLYLQAKDIKNGFLSVSNPVFVSENYFLKNKRSHIKSGDIILSIMGNVGDIALIPPNWNECMANRAVAIIKNIEFFKPEYVFSFLRSKYGFLEIEKNKNGGVQERLNLDVLGKIEIPILSNCFQDLIETLVQKSLKQRNESERLYLFTQQLLDNNLINTPHLSNLEIFSKKKLSHSFFKSGRLDAEYYQPKYDEIIANLNTSETVGSLCNLHDKSFVPNNNIEYQYIELANVGASGNIDNVEKTIGKELPSRARRQVKTGQIIIASVEGSMQNCALITEEYNNALCSTGFYVLDSEKINSETLLVIFKSSPIQALLKQRCSGTILTAITKDELLNMPLPKIDDNVQKEISLKVQESFALRRKSEMLLEKAKRAVEITIEEGEENAIKWLTTNIASLEV